MLKEVLNVIQLLLDFSAGQSFRVIRSPWILNDISVEVRAVHETGGIAGKEGAGLHIPVTHSLVQQAVGVFLLGIGLLAIVGCAQFGGPSTERLIGALVSKLAPCIGFRGNISATDSRAFHPWETTRHPDGGALLRGYGNGCS